MILRRLRVIAVSAVVMATGNDWRGVEAGAHAYAATKGDNGGYGPLATWRVAATLVSPFAIEMISSSVEWPLIS